MKLVLNELSAKFPVESVEFGRNIMKCFLISYGKMRNIIHNDQIILDRDYQSIELACNYNIAKWRNDKDVDQELIRLFRSLLNRSETYDHSEFSSIIKIRNSEFIHENNGSVGCLIAYETDNCVISFLSEPYWKNNYIEGSYLCLNESTGDVDETRVRIINTSCDDNIEAFRREYGKICETELLRSFHSGTDILVQNEMLFPNLVFCKNAVKQLKHEIDCTNIYQISRKLFELQGYFENIGDIFDKTQLNHADPESPETLKTYTDEHTFELPNGEHCVFSWHVRFTGKYEGRIFFRPDASSKKCYIGHIGGKLPTVKYH